MRRAGVLTACMTGLVLLAGCAGYRGDWPLLGDKPPAPSEPVEVEPVDEPDPISRLPQVRPAELDALMARSRSDHAALADRKAEHQAAYDAAKSRIVPAAPQEGGRAWWDAQMALTRLGGVAEGLSNLRLRLAAMEGVLTGPDAPADTDVGAEEVSTLLAEVTDEQAALQTYLAAERSALAALK